MTESTKRRGRPKIGNAKTAVERQREYRARLRAGLVPPSSKNQRIAELEAKVWEVEADNRLLRVELEQRSANVPSQCMAQGCAREAKTKRSVEIEACLCVGHAYDIDYDVPVKLFPRR